MKVKNLINMLEAHNLEAEVNFGVEEKGIREMHISSSADCKCTEKEIYFTVGYSK